MIVQSRAGKHARMASPANEEDVAVSLDDFDQPAKVAIQRGSEALDPSAPDRAARSVGPCSC